ncbi:MAG: NAD(P)-dependent oxidoreductase [Alphaproteobacteria bacterium]|nr:NAD(P)-dependent oxidoreductase [Alphaproteobacteria bacterium]
MATLLIPDFSIDTDPDLEVAAAGPHRVIVHRTRDPDAVPLADWQAADALVCHHLMPMGAAMVGRAPGCRVLVRAGVGYDHIDVPAWRAAGVPVCNVPDYGTTDIADFAMALLLSLARGIVPYHTGLVADPVGNWRARHPSPTVRRLKGLNCLVVGLGAIGMAFARRAAAADMQVGYYDPYRPNAIALGLGYTKFETLSDAMAWADVVSVHCLLSAETRHLINAEALAAARPGLILINTARGGCVDLSAVVAALEDGRLAGCGLDVLEQEPPDPSHPFLQGLTSGRWDGRVLLTPHSAFNSPQAGRDMRVKAIETARAFLETGVLRNPVGG